MVSGSPEIERGVVEHRTSASGRWLRARRLRFAAWIALLEGVLVVIHAIPRWPALIVAAGVIAIYLLYGRQSRSDTIRQTTWIGAASQAMMVLVPILFIIVGTVALIAVGVLAVIALVVLFSDRR